MKLDDILAELEGRGRKSARPSAAPKSTDPVDQFGSKLQREIERLESAIKAGGLPTNSKGWVSAIGDKYSVKYGSPAIPVGPSGNLYFKADDLPDALKVLTFGKELAKTLEFQDAIRNQPKRGKQPVENEAKPKRRRGPNKPKAV